VGPQAPAQDSTSLGGRPLAHVEKIISGQAADVIACAARKSNVWFPRRRTGIDVNLPLQIANLDASIGRIAALPGTPKEGPESAP
jgi:hypothetical protein